MTRSSVRKRGAGTHGVARSRERQEDHDGGVPEVVFDQWVSGWREYDGPLQDGQQGARSGRQSPRLTSDEATCRRPVTLLPSVPAGGGIRPCRRSAAMPGEEPAVRLGSAWPP